MCVIVSDCCFDSEVVSTSSARDKNCLSAEACGVSHVISSFPSVTSGGSPPCASAVVTGAALAMTKLGVSICCVGPSSKDKENRMRVPGRTSVWSVQFQSDSLERAGIAHNFRFLGN